MSFALVSPSHIKLFIGDSPGIEWFNNATSFTEIDSLNKGKQCQNFYQVLESWLLVKNWEDAPQINQLIEESDAVTWLLQQL